MIIRLLTAAGAFLFLAAGLPAAGDPGDDAATVTGTVTFKGDAPKRKKIKMEADPQCLALHDKPQLSEEAVVDKEGRVQWCFVYVKGGLEGKTFETPKEPVVLQQKGCRYDPHVLGIMVGQDLTIHNGDPLMHNVHAIAKRNGEFNFGQPKQGMETSRKFDNPEVMVKFKCDVHPWMSAWLGVLTHPYYAVTGADGKYEIKGLPPGKYTLEVWHETFGTKSEEFEVKAGETKTADFVYEKK
ncbi:MAG: carboxypeptidase regulatory-like domain-containing protein [Planctomycetes bacterium]|nr:carboxypeptidase regulatory-like domain-containing protein [Planctomycetota bacterium]